MALIKVKNSKGDIQYVPEHWLDHPKFGKGFTLAVKKQSKQDAKAPASSNVKEKKDA